MQLLIEGLQGDGIGRCTDRSGHTTDIGGDWDAHGQRDASLSVGRKGGEDRGKEGEHHGGGGCVGYEHREDACDEQKAQQHVLALVAEGTDKVLGKQNVETRLGGCDGKDETAEE